MSFPFDKELRRLVQKSVADRKVDILKQITTSVKTNPVYYFLNLPPIAIVLPLREEIDEKDCITV
jgi:hypothetical protein